MFFYQNTLSYKTEQNDLPDCFHQKIRLILNVIWNVQQLYSLTDVIAYKVHFI